MFMSHRDSETAVQRLSRFFANERTAVLLLFGLAALAQLPLVDRGHVPLDEGQLTAIGRRLVEGEYLYRDIYTGIFPGIYWSAEALFRVFGVDALVARYAQLVANAALAVSVYRTTLRMASPVAGWLAGVAVIALVYLSFPGLCVLHYSTVSLALVLEAGLAAADYAKTAHKRDGIRAGLLLALATLVKQNYGALALLATGLGLLWSRPRGPLAARGILSAAAPVVLSGLALAGVAACYLLITKSFTAFWQATVVTLPGPQLATFTQPLPPVFGPHPRDELFLFLYAPGLLFCYLLLGVAATAGGEFLNWISISVRVGYGAAWLSLAAAPLLLWRRVREERSGGCSAARILIPLGAAMFFGIFPSAIWAHLAEVLPAQIPLLALLADDVLRFVVRKRLSVAARQQVARAVGVVSTVVIVFLCGKIACDVHQWMPYEFGLPGASLRVAERDRHLYGEALAFLRDCAENDETVFIAPDMPILYVAAGKRNPTPYDLVIPGDVRDEVIVERLQAEQTRCIVYGTTMLPLFKSFPVLFPEVYAHLRTEYELRGATEYQGTRWEFLARRQSSDQAIAAPSAPP
jgi:hypothetical protein